MRLLRIVLLTLCFFLLPACSPVKKIVTNQYQLNAFSVKKLTSHPGNMTLSVSTPEAMAGYQTEAMLYMNKPYQIEHFAKNSWVSPPADMLFSLITQSLQATGYFEAVVSSPYNQGADYRLDTQLLALKQNFLKRPSVLEFSAKVALFHVEDNQVLASRIIHIDIPCATDTPFGGVVAANEATRQFTAQVVQFVMSHIPHK